MESASSNEPSIKKAKSVDEDVENKDQLDVNEAHKEEDGKSAKHTKANDEISTENTNEDEDE